MTIGIIHQFYNIKRINGGFFLYFKSMFFKFYDLLDVKTLATFYTSLLLN